MSAIPWELSVAPREFNFAPKPPRNLSTIAEGSRAQPRQSPPSRSKLSVSTTSAEAMEPSGMSPPHSALDATGRTQHEGQQGADQRTCEDALGSQVQMIVLRRTRLWWCLFVSPSPRDLSLDRSATPYHDPLAFADEHPRSVTHPFLDRGTSVVDLMVAGTTSAGDSLNPLTWTVRTVSPYFFAMVVHLLLFFRVRLSFLFLRPIAVWTLLCCCVRSCTCCDYYLLYYNPRSQSRTPSLISFLVFAFSRSGP